MQQDTDQSRAVTLKHISPTWAEWFDEQYGSAIQQNGGYVEFQVKFERGRPRPHWLSMTLRFLPGLERLLTR